jgi:carboxyl-terminal processing protease
MGEWIKGLILSVFSLAILLGTALDRSTEAPTAENYWLQTGISQKELFQFIQDSYCHSSDRYFLACLNAIQQVAIRNGQILVPNGTFQKIENHKNLEFNEKELLSPWTPVLAQRPSAERLVSFQALWEKLERDYIEKSKRSMMIGIALNGFLSVFRDPHTYIIPIDYYKQIVASSDYRASSYGFVLTKIQSDFFVKKVIPGSPSEFAGLRRGQKIRSLNDWDLDGLTLGALNERIRNEKGDELEIEVESPGGPRRSVKVKKSTQALTTVHLRFLPTKTSIALLSLDRFSRKSCEKVKAALIQVKESGARNLIIDLRDNPGGQMDEAGCIASLFLGPDRRIFTVRYADRPSHSEAYISENSKVFWGKTVILVNRGTASAAEILAGVLREYDRAILVGERTFGKGSFQEGDIWSLNSKIALFETKGFYYLPSGFSPQKLGLSPDLSVESPNSGSREEGLYWNSLDLTQAIKPRQLYGLPFELCSNQEALASEGDDPEIVKAQQALSCWGVAQVSGG